MASINLLSLAPTTTFLHIPTSTSSSFTAIPWPLISRRAVPRPLVLCVCKLRVQDERAEVALGARRPAWVRGRADAALPPCLEAPRYHRRNGVWWGESTGSTTPTSASSELEMDLVDLLSLLASQETRIPGSLFYANWVYKREQRRPVGIEEKLNCTCFSPDSADLSSPAKGFHQAMDSSHHNSTPVKHEDDVCSSDDDLTMSDSSCSDEDESSSDPDDCCHHIKKIRLLEEMLAKTESDNKILVQRINYDKKMADSAKKKQLEERLTKMKEVAKKAEAEQNIGGCS